MNQKEIVELVQLRQEKDKLLEAIKEHHRQKADDRCIFDDDKMYAAAGLPPCDRRVGSKAEMLKNCARFIDRRCEEGKWPTYQELLELVEMYADHLDGNGLCYPEALSEAVRKIAHD